MCSPCRQGASEGQRVSSPGTRVTEGCDPSVVSAGNWPGSSARALSAVNTEPSIQSLELLCTGATTAGNMHTRAAGIAVANVHRGPQQHCKHRFGITNTLLLVGKFETIRHPKSWGLIMQLTVHHQGRLVPDPQPTTDTNTGGCPSILNSGLDLHRTDSHPPLWFSHL